MPIVDDPSQAYAVDFETYYDAKYSLKVMPTWAYVHDPRFSAYMVSVAGPDNFLWVGHPRAFDWTILEGKVVLHHNASFDALVYNKLVEDKLVPKVNFAAIYDTADLAAYLQHPRALKDFAKFIWGEREIADEGKLVRLLMLGKATDDLWQNPRVLQYATYDAKHCRRLWMEYSHTWPWEERELSRLNREAFFRGCAIDTDYVDKAVADLQDQLHQAGRSIPWDWSMNKTPLSRVKIIQNCENTILSTTLLAEVPAGQKVELPKEEDFCRIEKRTGDGTDQYYKVQYLDYPASFAQDDPECEEWEDTWGDVYSWIGAIRDWRRINMLLGKFKHLQDYTFNGIFHPQTKYFGARTGRFSGDGKFNVQNLPREVMFGWDLRRCFIARPGHMLVFPDYAQIEARALKAMVRDEKMLTKLRAGMSIYEAHARDTMGWTGGELKKENPRLYKLAKARVLGAGYGCGPKKFAAVAKTMAGIEISLEEASKTVYDYRETNQDVVRLWQHLDLGIRKAAIQNQECHTLFLPSGRPLYYWRPRYRLHVGKKKKTKDVAEGDEKPQALQLMAMFQKNVAGSYRKVYGGLLTENCLGKGTLVLTSNGWKPIEVVADSDLVHDGVDFVSHGGSVSRSVQPCVVVDGVRMTADHEVLTDEGWKPALEKPRPYRPDLRGLDRYTYHEQQRTENALGVPVSVRAPMYQAGSRSDQGSSARANPELRLSDARTQEQGAEDTRYVQTSGLFRMEEHAGSLPPSYASSVEKLRRARNNCVLALAGFFRRVLGRHGSDLPEGFGAGSAGQQQGVRPGELPLDHAQCQYSEQSPSADSGLGIGCSRQSGHRKNNLTLPGDTRLGNGRSVLSPSIIQQPVYDILNCGPRHRFVVLGNGGPFIVHNCIQALSRDLIRDGWIALAKRGFNVLFTIHDEYLIEMPIENLDARVKEMEAILLDTPEWAKHIPVAVETTISPFYKK